MEKQKRMTSEQTRMECLKFLKDLHSTLKFAPTMSMTGFLEQYRVNKNMPMILQKGGIIKNTGGAGRSARYEWITIPPNMSMAEESIRRLNEYIQSKKTVQPKKSKEKKEVEKPVKNQDLRDDFAKTALQGLMVNAYANNTNIFKRLLNLLGIGKGYADLEYNYQLLAKESYAIADVMIKQRQYPK